MSPPSSLVPQHPCANDPRVNSSRTYWIYNQHSFQNNPSRSTKRAPVPIERNNGMPATSQSGLDWVKSRTHATPSHLANFLHSPCVMVLLDPFFTSHPISDSQARELRGDCRTTQISPVCDIYANRDCTCLLSVLIHVLHTGRGDFFRSVSARLFVTTGCVGFNVHPEQCITPSQH